MTVVDEESVVMRKTTTEGLITRATSPIIFSGPISSKFSLRKSPNFRKTKSFKGLNYTIT